MESQQESVPLRDDDDAKELDATAPSPRLASSSSTLTLFWELARPFFVESHPLRRAALLRGAALVALCCVRTGLFVFISYAQRDFSTALSAKNVPNFHAACFKFAGVVCVAAPLFAFYEYFTAAYALLWRNWMTEQLVASYFDGSAFYHLGSRGGIDNPDQRLTDDVRLFVGRSVDFSLLLLGKVLNMLAFCSVLYTISPTLVAVLLLYSLFGTVGAARLFGASLKVTLKTLQTLRRRYATRLFGASIKVHRVRRFV